MEDIHHLIEVQTRKPSKVRLIGDLNEALDTLVLHNGGLAGDGHVIGPYLCITLTRGGVTSTEGELIAEDVRELRTIAVLTADNLLLRLVVVPTREQVAKDELRGVDLVLRMHLNGNTVAVILDINRDLIAISSHRDIDVLDGQLSRGGDLTADESVASIHDNLIEDLVEARIEGELTMCHLARCGIEDPANLLMCLRAADVGVRQLEDVLTMRMLLILISHWCV